MAQRQDTRVTTSVLGVFLEVLAAASWAQEVAAPRFAERADVLAVSVWIRSEGAALAKDRLEVLVDGHPVQVLAVDPLDAEAWGIKLSPADLGGGQSTAAWPPAVSPPAATAAPGQPPAREVAVVIAAHLCSRFCRAEASRVLARDAEALVRLGPVRVVVARWQGPQELLRGVQDAEILRRFAREKLPGVWVEDTFERERSALTHEVWRRWGNPSRFGPAIGEAQASLAKAARLRLILAQIKMAVVSGRQAPGTVLVLISDGFEAVPFRAWQRFMEGMPGAFDLPWERGGLPEEGQDPAADPATRFARHLAAEGVVAVPYFLGLAGAASPSWAAAASGSCAFREFMTVGYGNYRPHRLMSESTELLRNPQEGLQVLASETGGVVVAGGEALAASWPVADLYLLTYQVGGVPDGQLHRLEVRQEDAKKLWAPAFVRHGAASLGDEGAVRALLAWGQTPGPLPVRAELTQPRRVGKDVEATLTVSADFAPVFAVLRQAGLAQITLVAAVDLGDPDPFLYRTEFSEEVSPQEGSTWTFQGLIRLPKKATKIAVLVEERGTGARGGTTVELAPGR